MGAGPAFAKNRLFYQEVHFDGACNAGTGAECPLNVINRSETHVGESGSVSYNMGMGPHAALSARFQLFRFPTETFPALLRGPANVSVVSVRDLSEVFGLGLKFSY